MITNQSNDGNSAKEERHVNELVLSSADVTNSIIVKSWWCSLSTDDANTCRWQTSTTDWGRNRSDSYLSNRHNSCWAQSPRLHVCLSISYRPPRRGVVNERIRPLWLHGSMRQGRSTPGQTNFEPSVCRCRVSMAPPCTAEVNCRRHRWQ